MTVKHLTIVWMLAMASFAAGCAPDCATLCEEQNGCKGAVKTDCTKSCDFAEKINEKAACDDQYGDLLSCLDDQEDVCKTGGQCEKKAAEYADCVNGYCINHAGDCTQ